MVDRDRVLRGAGLPQHAAGVGQAVQTLPQQPGAGDLGPGKARDKPTKTIHGGAAFVVPLMQDYAYLSLEPIQIEIPLRGALSFENIRVNVPSVFTVAIGTEPAVMQHAAIRLLGLSVGEIRKQAEEIIFGQLRQVIASMGIEEINRDRDKFLEHIQQSLEPELTKIGLQLINVNITDITDESGYIDAIGQKAASEAIQKARGDVADNEKMGEIRVADGRTRQDDSGGQRQQGTGDRHPQGRTRPGDPRGRTGEGTVVGEKAAGVRTRIAGQGRPNATCVSRSPTPTRRPSTAKTSPRPRSPLRRPNWRSSGPKPTSWAKAANAKPKRPCWKSRTGPWPRPRWPKPNASKPKNGPNWKRRPKPRKRASIVDAEAEAERKRIDAQAEADAIFAKLDAEARGQYEILAKKGDGLQRIVDACGGSKEAFQMLMLEHLDNLAEASAKAISNIKFDKVVVWENGGKNGAGNTADFLSSMAKTLPPMLQVMKDIGGVELPESLVKLSIDKRRRYARQRHRAARSPRTAHVVDDLVDRVLDDAPRAGGFQLRNDGADDRFVDDRVDVDPVGIGERRDGRLLQRRQQLRARAAGCRGARSSSGRPPSAARQDLSISAMLSSFSLLPRIGVAPAALAINRVVLCSTSSTIRRLFARSELPVSVTSTMASASRGGLTSVAPQENSTLAVTPCWAR